MNSVIVGIVAQNMWIGVLAGVLFTAAHFFTREWYAARFRKKMLSPEETALATKPWQLELKAESVALKGEDSFQEVALRNYRDLKETGRFLFLRFADGSCIGLSAFPTGAEQDAFCEALRIHTPSDRPSMAW